MLFASDLDNTLIHSHLKVKPGDICVEIKDGKELSFMSPKAHELLRVIRTRCRFVPVTTRSLEQYRRLSFPGDTPLEYALVSHGALLLVNGQVDEPWARESQERLKDCLPLLELYRKHLAGLFPDCRTSDGFFIFAKSENSKNAALELKAMVNPRLFSVCGVYNKVYIFPRRLSKGGAVKRLLLRLGEPEGPLVCAGDSRLDLSMLRIADKAIVPETYPHDGKNFVRASGGDFSVDVLQAVRDRYFVQNRSWGKVLEGLRSAKN